MNIVEILDALDNPVLGALAGGLAGAAWAALLIVHGANEDKVKGSKPPSLLERIIVTTILIGSLAWIGAAGPDGVAGMTLTTPCMSKGVC